MAQTDANPAIVIVMTAAISVAFQWLGNVRNSGAKSAKWISLRLIVSSLIQRIELEYRFVHGNVIYQSSIFGTLTLEPPHSVWHWYLLTRNQNQALICSVLWAILYREFMWLTNHGNELGLLWTARNWNISLEHSFNIQTADSVELCMGI